MKKQNLTVRNVVPTLLIAGGIIGSQVVHASTDYGPAIWRPLCNANYYTTGYGHKFHVVHDMEGYYASTINWFDNCSMTSASIHYAVNGKQDATSDAAPGEITQLGVRDAQYGWHARCWNQHSTGTEHEGFASNPAWYTDAQYQASAGITKNLSAKFGWAMDRNHVVGHGQKSVAGWASWASANLGIDPNCNTHTDPGPYWDWNKYMALLNGQNPPYLFGGGLDGWTAGNGICCGLGWNNSGWPGVIYGDQSANDAFFYSPPANFGGPGEAVINVNLYPQNGNTAAHDLQLFWKTSAENFWDAAKSTPIINYTAQNNWITLNLDASGNGKFVGQNINQLRLDFDNVNHGNRWIVNHVVVQSTLRWRFDSNAMGWTPGNGVSGITWTAGGWPGIIYFDQTGNDASIVSGGQFFNTAGPYHYIGGQKDTIHVRVYPQNGNTANHDMQVFWATEADGSWTEAKSTSATYVGQNGWVDVYLPVGDNANWPGAHITNLRLDFDGINHGNRWIVDFVAFEYRP